MQSNQSPSDRDALDPLYASSSCIEDTSLPQMALGKDRIHYGLPKGPTLCRELQADVSTRWAICPAWQTYPVRFGKPGVPSATRRPLHNRHVGIYAIGVQRPGLHFAPSAVNLAASGPLGGSTALCSTGFYARTRGRSARTTELSDEFASARPAAASQAIASSVIVKK
jgi:hypothetical protein